MTLGGWRGCGIGTTESPSLILWPDPLTRRYSHLLHPCLPRPFPTKVRIAIKRRPREKFAKSLLKLFFDSRNGRLCGDFDAFCRLWKRVFGRWDAAKDFWDGPLPCLNCTHFSFPLFLQPFTPSRDASPPSSLSEVLNSIKLRRRRRQQFVVKKRISSLETALDILGPCKTAAAAVPQRRKQKKVCAFFYLGSKREAIIRE